MPAIYEDQALTLGYDADGNPIKETREQWDARRNPLNDQYWINKTFKPNAEKAATIAESIGRQDIANLIRTEAQNPNASSKSLGIPVTQMMRVQDPYVENRFRNAWVQ